MSRGLFLNFEGGDGLGKSTQIKLLARAIKKAGRRVLVTREPGGTPVGELLRTILKEKEMSPLAEVFILEASRTEHVNKIILPALKKGMVVISDRYQESTLVYQGLVQGENLKVLRSLNKIATGGCNPTKVILLDGGERRLSGRSSRDKFDHKANSFHTKVRRAYLKLSKSEKNWIRINASKSIAEVHKEIIERLKPLIPRLRA